MYVLQKGKETRFCVVTKVMALCIILEALSSAVFQPELWPFFLNISLVSGTVAL